MKPKMRFKAEVQGETLSFAGGTFTVDDDGDLEIRISGSGWFTADQFLEVVATLQTEPIPEPKTPGQVLYEAARFAQVDYHTDWAELSKNQRGRWEAQAARLGIKGEG